MKATVYAYGSEKRARIRMRYLQGIFAARVCNHDDTRMAMLADELYTLGQAFGMYTAIRVATPSGTALFCKWPREAAIAQFVAAHRARTPG